MCHSDVLQSLSWNHYRDLCASGDRCAFSRKERDIMVDRKAIERYHRRVNQRLAKRGVRLDGERWEEDKHPRAKDGKFTSGNGVSSETSISREPPSASKKVQNININGPKETKAFIESYFSKHPEVKNEVKKYKDVFENVTKFTERFPNAEDENSYDPITGEKVDVSSGFCVTFHQNFEIGNEFGAYDSDTYAAMCAISMNELGAERCYIGYFGNPEISFNCPDEETAKRFAIEHNQHSVFNAATFELWENPYWDENTNPIKGKGSN